MGSCIICGSSVDGRVCELHEEDVVFEFKGTRPEQLASNRYYRGTVDGYAEFGIFVDIGDNVTGLLHKSELDQRLESVDLEPGDTVYVQVQNVRDNGNIDLGWSIRQDKSRFRGALIHDPEEGEERLPEETDKEPESESGSSGPIRQKPTEQAGQSSRKQRSEPEETKSDDSEQTEAKKPAVPDPIEVTVGELESHIGDRVRIEGEVETARQTSGPTVFELRDETGSVECAAFKEAGVRAYPEVDEGDIVRIEGDVERRHDDLQVETEALVILEDEEREEVTERMQEALLQRARPDSVEILTEDDTVGGIEEELRDVATAIRRAIIEGRPIVVRHAATADGYVASAAIERATLPLIREEHQGPDVEYHYFERRPVEGAVYDMDDATRDVTMMLSNQDRHGEQFPLFVFVAAGGTEESLSGFELLDVYGARRVVVDTERIDDVIEDAVDVLVSLDDGASTTATVLGSTIAATVNPEIGDDLRHLPAVSFWENTPEQYADLASDAGYDPDDVRKLREAVALEAYYQSYEDKRELIIDLLFADAAADPMGLAEHVSEQYRTRMETAIETADANLERFEQAGETILVLDTDAYTHRFEFPPKELLLDELIRQHRNDAVALLGVGTDEAILRSHQTIDVREIVESARGDAPKAALDARGAREGRVEFLSGERENARKSLLDALAAELSSAPVV